MSRRGRPKKYKHGRESVTLSWGKEQHKWFEQLRDLADTEGKPASQLVLKAIKEYLKRHKGGNPQLTLPKALTKELPSQAYHNLSEEFIRQFNSSSKERKKELVKMMKKAFNCQLQGLNEKQEPEKQGQEEQEEQEEKPEWVKEAVEKYGPGGEQHE